MSLKRSHDVGVDQSSRPPNHHGQLPPLSGESRIFCVCFPNGPMLTDLSINPNHRTLRSTVAGLALRLARLARASAEEEAKEIEPGSPDETGCL